MIDIEKLRSEVVHAQLQAVRDAKEPERDYIGASMIGHECDRFLWMTFHRYVEPSFTPGDDDDAELARMLRLFARGHREEHVLETMLRQAGVEIESDCFAQWSFREGFFSGHGDGKIIVHGEPAIVEYKTHNKASFATLKPGKLKSSHPKHYAQMQTYMRTSGRRYGLYVGVCKDDDSLFFDAVEYHRDDADGYALRAEAIAASDKPPARIARLPTSFPCKLCSAVDVCFAIEFPRVDCRNCTSATKYPEHGTFGCDLVAHQGTEQQRTQNVQLPPEGKCGKHSFNPYAINDLFGWEPIEFFPEHRAVKYRRKNDVEFINGEAPFGIPSDQLKDME